MYAYLYSKEEEENKKTGMMTSFAIHMLLLLILFCIPLAPIQKITEEFQGVVVDFGVKEAGLALQDVDEPAVANEAVTAEATPPNKIEEKVEEKVAEPQASATKVKVLSVTESKIIEEESPIVVEEKKVDHTDQLKKEAEEQERLEREKEAEAKRAAAQAEAERKLEAERIAAEEAAAKKALEENKSKFGSLFGQGSEGTVDANKGDELGKPDASALDAISSGKGTTGDGLNSRGIVFEPEIKDNSQKTGKVVVEVCVNNQGKVTSAKYTQRGSTTTDQYLVDLGVKNAKKYVFTPSDITEQCGSITINFVLN